MNNGDILIIDDEPQIRKMLEITLESNGLKAIHAATGKEGIIMAASHVPDLILLDLGLPDKNGKTVLTELRTWYNKPIIILSVQNSEEDIIHALDHGANDYLVKPFRTGELLARIRSCLRQQATADSPNIIKTRELEIDLTARTVKRKDEIIKLTSTEYDLMAIFSKNIGRVMTHRFLLNEIWGPGYLNETQYLRVFIAQLRKKIEENPNHPTHIITESGVGYRFA
jgi:two-component system KDP operon response regulator KdpE